MTARMTLHLAARSDDDDAIERFVSEGGRVDSHPVQAATRAPGSRPTSPGVLQQIPGVPAERPSAQLPNLEDDEQAKAELAHGAV